MIVIIIGGTLRSFSCPLPPPFLPSIPFTVAVARLSLGMLALTSTLLLVLVAVWRTRGQIGLPATRRGRGFVLFVHTEGRCVHGSPLSFSIASSFHPLQTKLHFVNETGLGDMQARFFQELRVKSSCGRAIFTFGKMSNMENIESLAVRKGKREKLNNSL